METEGHNIRVGFHARDYNFVAKRIREVFPMEQGERSMIERSILCILAMKFAHAYLEDNRLFDPLKFLDQCSPDAELYPLSELWGDD